MDFSMVTMIMHAIDGKPQCSVTTVLSLITAKWAVPILRELDLTPVRTRQFLKLLPGLNMKSLQKQLKTLQSTGMINRNEYEERLQLVEYSITPRGRKLLSALTVLKAISAEVVGEYCQCQTDGCFEKQLLPTEKVDSSRSAYDRLLR